MPLCQIALLLALMQAPDAPPAQLVKSAEADTNAPAPRPHLSAEAFRRAFEEAFDADDTDRVEALVKENQTEFVPLFEEYADIWTNANGEPGSREERALNCARAIAEAADVALEAPGLLEMTDALTSFDAVKRRQLRVARDAWLRGEAAEAKFLWREAIEAYANAEATMSTLSWSTGVARLLLRLGLCCDHVGQYDQATAHAARALELFQAIGYPQGIAFSLNNLGFSLLSLGQDVRALDCHNRALAIRKAVGSLPDIACSLLNIASCYHSMGQYPKAIDYYNRALGIRETLGNQQEIANSLLGLGRTYYALGDYEQAMGYASRAFGICEAIGAQQEVSTALGILGSCYRELGKYEQAIDHLSRAFKIDEAFGNQRDVAYSLINLSACYYPLGEYEKTIDQLSRTLRILEAIGNQRDIAVVLTNQGICYGALGQYEKAIEHHKRALAMLETIGEQDAISNSLEGLGTCYFSLGQYAKALDYDARALAIREAVGKQQAVAHSLGNLGSCYFGLGQYEQAIDHDRRALKIHEAIGNQQDVARSLSSLAIRYGALGQYETATDLEHRALRIREAIGNQNDIADSYRSLGRCYEAQGERETAIDFLRRAIAIHERIGNPLNIAYDFDLLAQVHLADAHPDAALGDLERCVAALGRVGRRTQSEEGRAEFAQTWALLPLKISEAVRNLAAKPEAHAIERGLPLLESLLARSVLEALQEKAEQALECYDAGLVEARRRAMNRMTELRLLLARDTGTEGDAGQAQELRQRMAAEEQALEKLEEDLRRSNPRLAQLITPTAASLTDVHKNVLGDRQAMVLFVLGEKESFAWVITRTVASIVTLPAEKELRRMYDALVSSLTGTGPFVAPARALFQGLLAPLWPMIEGTSELIIVPDGFLAFLPFEVLLTRDPSEGDLESVITLPYLLREKIVRYAPSASILVWYAQHGSGRSKWRKDICLIGDPIYDSEVPSDGLAMRAINPSAFARLERTRQEVLGVAEALIGDEESKLFLTLRDLKRTGHVAGRRFELYLGREANRQTLAQDSCSYRIVHLAVHGYFDAEFPWFSGLVLSHDQDGSSGFLNTIDIATLRLDAQLVFLSACETARGKLTKADGIRNTARSFMLAGAESVVATQWNVADDAAAVLAQAFYEKLFGGATPAEALRDAKLALIEHRIVPRGARPLARSADTNRWAHPSFWAPFVLWGGG